MAVETRKLIKNEAFKIAQNNVRSLKDLKHKLSKLASNSVDQ